MLYLLLIVTAAGALMLRRPLAHAVRFARAPRAARAHYRAMCWAAIRWRWLARNAGIAYLDEHRRRLMTPRWPGSTAVSVSPVPVHKLRWPRARFTVDEFGWTAHVRTIPKIGRAELADAAPWLADAWRCHRVQITQAEPGRVAIRGMRRDPLHEVFPMADAPAGVFTGADAPGRLYLGRDAFGQHRWQRLANLPAVLVGGMPGYGKTCLILSWLCQLMPFDSVRLGVIADGKGGGDFADWEPLTRLVGDNLHDAAEALTLQAEEMTSRLAEWPARYGVRNLWKLGPAADRPLQLNVVDECHTYLDLDSVRGDKQGETDVRQCRHAVGQLVRKGRSVMCLTVLATQKQTGDSVPTSIRDNVPLALSFATRTREAAVACLGDAIREYPDQCPTQLAAAEYVGVATALLRTGRDPYTQIRHPEVTEDQAAEVAAALTSAPVLRAVPPLEVEGPAA